MAPLWLPRSVPSAWCVPAIEPRPQQTAQTILGSSCTRRQGCGGWCRAVRRVLALVALGVTSGYINVQAGGLGTLLRLRSMGVVLSCYRRRLAQMRAVSDACCLRCMLCASECLEALPCSSHTCHVYASGVTRVAVLVAWTRGTRRGSDLLRAWRRRGQPAHIMYAQR